MTKFWTSLAALLLAATSGQGEALPWRQVPFEVGEALAILRREKGTVGETIGMDLEGSSPGAAAAEANGTGNFDAARHLSWVIADVNGDGRPDVFLVVTWPPAYGTNPFLRGGLIVSTGQRRWRFACEIEMVRTGATTPPVHLLPRHGRGWREFAIQGLRPRPIRYRWLQRDGQMICDPETWEERP